MPRFASILLLALLFSGCAHQHPTAHPPPPPPEITKPKPRPIRPGDYVLKGDPESLPDGTVVCHRPIQLIDSTKRKEDGTTYKCR